MTNGRARVSSRFRSWPPILGLALVGLFAALVAGQNHAPGVSHTAWKVVGSRPTVTDIRPDSVYVQWPIYDQFNPSTHYQVRVNSMLYGHSVQVPGVLVRYLLPGTVYQVAVLTYHNGVVVGVSSAASVLTGPSTPAGVYATAIGTTTFTLHWLAVPTATTYRVYRVRGPLLTEVSASFTTALLSGFAPGEKVSVEMTATNLSGESYRSASLTVQLRPPPPPVTIRIEEIGQTEFLVRWTPAAGADRYSVLLDGIVKATVGSDTMQYKVASLTPAASYTCQLRAENSSGISELSSPTVVLLRPADPSPPIALDIGSLSVTLAWPAVTGADGYKVYVDKEWVVKNLKATTSVTISGWFNPGDLATFTLVAYNTTGDSGHSLPLPVAFVTASGTASPPTLLARATAAAFPALGSFIGDLPVRSGDGGESLFQALGGRDGVLLLVPAGSPPFFPGAALERLPAGFAHVAWIVLRPVGSGASRAWPAPWRSLAYPSGPWIDRGLDRSVPTLVLVDRFGKLRRGRPLAWIDSPTEFVGEGFSSPGSAPDASRRRFEELHRPQVRAD